MDYRAMAEELLSIRAGLLHVPAIQHMTNLVKVEMSVLNYLVTHENRAHPKDMSRDMLVSTARIAAILNHMEGKGLLTRTHDPEDNRQVIVSLTRAGMKEIQKRREEAICYIMRMLDYLGPEEAKEYLRIQEKIIHGFAGRR